MNRRWLSLGITALVIATVLLLAAQQQPGAKLPLLERALKAKDTTPPAAVLIEMGLKDEKPGDWSGSASVHGAKVVHREGYRFRKDDKLIEPDSWQAKTNYSIRAPKNDPVVKKMEGVGPVGVVLLLGDIGNDATITVKVNEMEAPANVDVKQVLAGETVELWGGAARVRRTSTAMPVATGPTEDDQPAATYGPDGTLWVAYTSYTLRDPKRTIEALPYKEKPKDFKHLYRPGFAEQIWVRPYRDGKWGQPMPVTDAKQDIARCAIAVMNNNQVWIIYSANRDGNFDIYARGVLRGDDSVAAIWSAEVRLTDNAGPDLAPVACIDSKGIINVAYQSWQSNGLARLGHVTLAGGKWSQAKLLHAGDDFGNCWHPAIAAGANGEVAIAYDVYCNGDYDVYVEMLGAATVWRAATGSQFQARPALTFDTTGKLWVAHEVGPVKWGKDYGALDSEDGNPLYNGRTVEVRCVDVSELKGQKLDNVPQWTPAADLPRLEITTPKLPFEAIKTNKFERFPRYAYPQIGLDGKGSIWLTYRRNFGSRYSSHPGAIWKTFARRLGRTGWTPEIEVHHSDGLLDHRPGLLPHVSGGLAIVHNTDGRESTPEHINNQIYVSIVDSSAAQAPATLEGFKQAITVNDWFKKEQADVKAIKDYRVKSAGKTYQLLRGEYHRHTEISWDGSPDGSLEDMFRYAIDAAAFDWIGNGDHDNGAGREYPWYLTQKYTAAYTVAKKFTPMFTYERSVGYPHGHRNVMFAKRGVMTLPRLAPPEGEKGVAGVHEDDAKMLYTYLHEMDGICAMHTSATGMGTDWRDNDPKVEPIVEIYQGDRMSYEHPGAPRSGYDPQAQALPANVGGWKPLGFIDNALKVKGYKLGFQASSDHWSTHISYFIVLAEEHSRDGILAAVKKRHCYGATDNIILDVRSGDHIQGDEFTTPKAPTIEFTVIGTDTIAKVDVMKDSQALATYMPNKKEYEGKWTDPDADGKVHYYYIRVVQANGEIAWASPMWITKK